MYVWMDKLTDSCMYLRLCKFRLKLQVYMLSSQAHCCHCFSWAPSGRQFVKRICNLFYVSYLLLWNSYDDVFNSISPLPPYSFVQYARLKAGWLSPSWVSLPGALRKPVVGSKAAPSPPMTLPTTAAQPLCHQRKGSHQFLLKSENIQKLSGLPLLNKK